ncbi:hypothetical protein PG989_013068 [Apiospora arundinis]
MRSLRETAPSQPNQGLAIPAQELVSKQDQRPSRLPSSSMGRVFGWRGVRSKATFLGGEVAVLSTPRHWVAPRQVPKTKGDATSLAVPGGPLRSLAVPRGAWACVAAPRNLILPLPAGAGGRM